MERTDIITMHNKPLTLVGNSVNVGDKAPDFELLDTELSARHLEDFKGKIKVISVTPSLDTPVCDLQVNWFNQDASNQSADVAVLNISADLPFAIKRFCSARNIDKVVVLSDHRDTSFGIAYGVLIKELRMLARSIFIIDKEDILRYIQIVNEQTNEPDYKAAIDTLKTLL